MSIYLLSDDWFGKSVLIWCWFGYKNLRLLWPSQRWADQSDALRLSESQICEASLSLCAQRCKNKALSSDWSPSQSLLLCGSKKMTINRCRLVGRPQWSFDTFSQLLYFNVIVNQSWAYWVQWIGFSTLNSSISLSSHIIIAARLLSVSVPCWICCVEHFHKKWKVSVVG